MNHSKVQTKCKVEGQRAKGTACQITNISNIRANKKCSLKAYFLSKELLKYCERMFRLGLFCFMLRVCFSDFSITHCKWKGRWESNIKCLVPIYISPEMKLPSLVISRTELQCSVSQFPHSCICEGFIYSQRRSSYFAAVKYIGRPILEIYKSLTDTWTWELGTRPGSFIYGNT